MREAGRHVAPVGHGEKAGVHGEHQAGTGNRAGEVGRSFLAGVGSGGCVLRAQLRMVGCGGGQTETGPETCANGLSLPRRLSPLGLEFRERPFRPDVGSTAGFPVAMRGILTCTSEQTFPQAS